MYARDSKDTAMVSSEDGAIWGLVNSADFTTIKASVTAPTVIPGKGELELGEIAIGGGWTGKYYLLFLYTFYHYFAVLSKNIIVNLLL